MVKASRFQEPTESQQVDIRAGLAFLLAFHQENKEMPLSYARAFLAVALKPGFGVSEYAQQLDMLQPVTSRILLEIGQKTRNGGPGLELIDSARDPQDLRFVRYYLTPKGEKLMARVYKAAELIRKDAK